MVKDLIHGHLAQNNTTGEPIQFEAVATQIKGLDTDAPTIHYQQNGELHTLHCDFVAGCDGYHGISRAALPTDSYREYRVEYPFSWLGILTRAVPASDELIYAYHERGFALLSLRSPTVSRLYIQVANDDKIENWSDEKIWDELDLRLSDGPGFRVNRGKIFEKSITPMRSFMIDNMQHGRLLLAGDAAHIVPPTGGKGLNLAVAEPWHIQRDGFAEFTNWRALVSGTLGKLGQDVLIMGQTEIGEVVENATGGGKSSAMPHKNNPVLSEALVALARQNAQFAALQLQSLVHGNERDATAWLLEWENLPRMIITTATALNHAVSVTKTINVNMELG